MTPEHLSPFGRNLLNRRDFMSKTALSIGSLGLAHLLAADAKEYSDSLKSSVAK